METYASKLPSDISKKYVWERSLGKCESAVSVNVSSNIRLEHLSAAFVAAPFLTFVGIDLFQVLLTNFVILGTH